MRIGRSRARGRLCPRLVGVRLVAAEQFVAGERGITCFSLPEKWRTVSQLLLTIFAEDLTWEAVVKSRPQVQPHQGRQAADHESKRTPVLIA